MLIASFAFGQVINNFDTAAADTNYWMWFDNQGGQHYQTNSSADSAKGWILIEHVASPVYEGAGAMKLQYSVHNTEGWGGYTKLEHWHPDSNSVYDWSGYDSIAVWYYVAAKQTLPARVELRLCLHDVSHSVTGNKTYNGGDVEYYYSFLKVLDSEPGWKKFKLALRNDPNAWNGEAFNRTGWSGIAGNNEIDGNKIKGFSIEFSISGSGDGDFSTGTVILDHLTLVGRKHRDFIFFNGRDFPTSLSTWSWGQSTIEVQAGAGPVPGTNAAKWVQGNEWSNGWTGIGASINPPYNMEFEWPTDTLKFKLKAEPGVGALRVQLESGAGKVGTVFTPTADNEWHSYGFKLTDMVYQDGTTNFNPANVNVIGMMAEASGIAGKVLYITDWWTGNPSIDVVAPAAPTAVSGVPGQYYNLVLWQDVAGETGEAYHVYASENPITDLEAPGVETVATNVMEGEQTVAHFIKYPLKDKVVQYYYAVVCKDAAGNLGPAGTSGAVSNTAKGIPTISMTPPSNFVADGDISEWESTGIMPFILKPSESNWSLGTFTDDNDLNATCYIAIDQDYLYFACDVIDDIYSFDPAGDFWQDDVIEFYIGLYNTTKTHVGFKRGAEPDYKFMALATELRNDPDYRLLYPLDSPNYEYVNFGASDWAVEFKIALDDLLVGGAQGDTRFRPLNGMKITMDINIGDSDKKNEREGMLSYSDIAKDNSYVGPQYWGFTWIGDTNKVVTSVKESDLPVTVNSYSLEQNYPNPFNPTTTIGYTLPQTTKVLLEIYNTQGQKVATLVNRFQPAGRYQVKVDGAMLSTGIYFYKLTTANFTETRKMLLFK